MGEIFDHIRIREYPTSMLDITGPGVFGECWKHINGIDDAALKLKSYDNFLYPATILDSKTVNGVHIVLDGEKHIVSLGQGGIGYPDEEYSDECKPTEHYSHYFRERSVYDEEIFL